jgi:hypothetical protein
LLPIDVRLIVDNVEFFDEILGRNNWHHLRKVKSELKKTTYLIHIGRVKDKSSNFIRGVSNKFSDEIKRIFSNFSDMPSEESLTLSRSSKNLK